MVRIKQRYLLLNILYPAPPPSSSSHTAASRPTPSYLSLHAPTPSYLTPPLLAAHLRNHIATHFGDTALGLTAPSLKVVYLSPATSTAIIRCPRAHVKLVWASLTYMTELPGPRRQDKGMECVIRVVRTSGTIRKSEEELIRRARAEVTRAKRAEEDGESDVLAKLISANEPATAISGPVGGGVEADELDYDSESEGA